MENHNVGFTPEQFYSHLAAENPHYLIGERLHNLTLEQFCRAFDGGSIYIDPISDNKKKILRSIADLRVGGLAGSVA